jgi:hypothetical protein
LWIAATNGNSASPATNNSNTASIVPTATHKAVDDVSLVMLLFKE